MRTPIRTTARLLSVITLGTCWPADLPIPAEQLQPVWTRELTDVVAPAHIGVTGNCVIWLLAGNSNRLERWSCAGQHVVAPKPTQPQYKPPALLVQIGGAVTAWSADLQPIFVVGDSSASSVLAGARKLSLSTLARAFLDQSLSLYCGDSFGRGALEENRIRLITWHHSTADWVELKQLAPVASSAIPSGSETIPLEGLAEQASHCLVSREDDVVISWSPQPEKGAAADSTLRGALERLSAGAPAERIKFLDAAYDHDRNEVWLRQHRIARPKAVQFLITSVQHAGTRRRVGTRAVAGRIEAFASHAGDVYLVTRATSGRFLIGRYAVRPARPND